MRSHQFADGFGAASRLTLSNGVTTFQIEIPCDAQASNESHPAANRNVPAFGELAVAASTFWVHRHCRSGAVRCAGASRPLRPRAWANEPGCGATPRRTQAFMERNGLVSSVAFLGVDPGQHSSRGRQLFILGHEEQAVAGFERRASLRDEDLTRPIDQRD